MINLEIIKMFRKREQKNFWHVKWLFHCFMRSAELTPSYKGQIPTEAAFRFRNSEKCYHCVHKWEHCVCRRWKVGGWILHCASLQAKVSLGKTLNSMNPVCSSQCKFVWTLAESTSLWKKVLVWMSILYKKQCAAPAHTAVVCKMLVWLVSYLDVRGWWLARFIRNVVV